MTLNIDLTTAAGLKSLSAVKSIIKSGIPADGLEEKHIDEYLYTKATRRLI